MLSASFDPARDPVLYAEIRRGDITVHNERVAHGSGPNQSTKWRRAYVVAFRSRFHPSTRQLGSAFPVESETV